MSGGGKAYESSKGDNGTLSKAADGSFKYVNPEGDEWRFDALGLQTE